MFCLVLGYPKVSMTCLYVALRCYQTECRLHVTCAGYPTTAACTIALKCCYAGCTPLVEHVLSCFTPAACVLPVATSHSVVAAQMHESAVIPLCYHAGCTLPVEMFFPIREYPTPALEEALAEVGVVCRPLPQVDLPHSNATDTETDLSGFTMKVAALLLSRFQEVSRGVEPKPELCGYFTLVAACIWKCCWHLLRACCHNLQHMDHAGHSFEHGNVAMTEECWSSAVHIAIFA